MTVFGRNADARTHQHRVIETVLIALVHELDRLAFHVQHRGSCDLRSSHGVLRFTELACLQTPVEFLPDLAIRRLSHATIECAFENSATVFNGGALENMIASVCHC